MQDDPRVILDPAVTQSLQGEVQASNYVRERIEAVKQAIASMPPRPTDPLTGQIYLSWHRKTMILYGQALGALQAAQAFGHISVEMFQGLKRELLGVLSQTMLKVQLRP